MFAAISYDPIPIFELGPLNLSLHGLFAGVGFAVGAVLMVREARATRPDLPVLFMSGYAEEQLRKSIDIDKVAFLPKPFSVQELAEAARKALTPV